MSYRNAVRDREIIYIPASARTLSNFDTNAEHLRISLKWLRPNLLSVLERVKITFDDGLTLQNVFIVNKVLFYYYTEAEYFVKTKHVRDDNLIYIPKINLLDFIGKEEADIDFITLDNKPKTPIVNILGFWYKKLNYDPVDTLAGVRRNMIMKIYENIAPTAVSDTLEIIYKKYH